ncbi:MAG: 6-phosphogluconolactonase, partial [Prevotellaceae bacterium]|nr:6-phosphogluconolactonase [Prevotellaceae bacterium]
MRTDLSSMIQLNKIPKRYYRPDDVIELSRVTRNERIPAKIFVSEKDGSTYIAGEIAALIKEKAQKNENCVIGFTNGKSTTGIYNELIRMYREEGLSFRNVVAFNLFEYYPLSNSNLGCLAQMKEALFDKVDILPENIHSLRGMMKESEIIASCIAYEEKIASFGGIDFQILGIGRSGNIGFNEPGLRSNSTTRLVLLDNVSRKEASDMFGTYDAVPISAITMGIGTILKAKRIVLVAWGEHKASVIRDAIEESFSERYPASSLQLHSNSEVVINLSAAADLTRISRPWLVTSCDWDDKLIRRAIVWLCQKINKPILKLTNKDYNENGLSELPALYGSA